MKDAFARTAGILATLSTLQKKWVRKAQVLILITSYVMGSIYMLQFDSQSETSGRN